jgi:hypothetical protein
VAPKMPQGLTPQAVAERIVLAIEGNDAVVAANDFES